jgi:hypothetical protein
MDNISFENLIEAHVPQVHQLQNEWAYENVTFGIVIESMADIKVAINPYCYVALDNEKIVGYLTATIIEGNEYNVFPKVVHIFG